MLARVEGSEKVRENKLRRKAARMGYRVSKSRSRDPDAMDFGLYAIIDNQTNGLMHASLADHWSHALTLDQVEHWLTSDDE